MASLILAIASLLLLAGLFLFSCWVADAIIAWIDRRISNPVPRFGHPAWKGNGA